MDEQLALVPDHRSKLVASQCACCGRPLKDAVSVEVGIGPECRKRVEGDVPPANVASRTQANAIVMDIACSQTTEAAFEGCTKLFKMGYYRLARHIFLRFATVVVSEENDDLVIKTPFNQAFVDRIKILRRNAEWVRPRKVWVVHKKTLHRVPIWDLICSCFPGTYGMGVKGPFRIPKTAQ